MGACLRGQIASSAGSCKEYQGRHDGQFGVHASVADASSVAGASGPVVCFTWTVYGHDDVLAVVEVSVVCRCVPAR